MTSAQRHWPPVRRLFEDPRTGELAIVEVPNLPLVAYLVVTILRLALQPHGGIGTVLAVIGAVSLGVWSALEIARGHSPFRRVLGAVVLVGMVVGMLLR